MIECLFPSRYFCTGDTAVCLIRGSQCSREFDSAIIFAQIHGHISVDFRWLKTTQKINDVFVDKLGPSLENHQLTVSNPVQIAQNHIQHCIFSTSSAAISPSHVFSGGAFLEFFVPKGLLPTYRGLCSSVYYFITLVVQFPSSIETLHYPVFVQGGGSSTLPFQVRHSSIVSYPVSTLPDEIFLSAPTPGYKVAQSDNTDTCVSSRKEIPTVYMIRDREHICNLHLPSKHGIIGKDFSIALDFTECLQECSVVRAVLIASELRPDDSRIQEKVVAKVTLTATDALHLNLSLSIPAECPCSFETPLFRLSYRLDVDFCLERRRKHSKKQKNSEALTEKDSPVEQEDEEHEGRDSPIPLANQGAEAFDSAFSCSIPVDVYQAGQVISSGAHASVSNLVDNDIAGGEAITHEECNTTDNLDRSVASSLFVQQQALRCIESDCAVLPI